MKRGDRRPGPKGGSPRVLRALNERAVLDALGSLGPLARPRLAEETHLSKPTISLVLADLMEAGLVCQEGKESGSRGPNALLYRLDASAGLIAGFDVGREWVRGALADMSGTIVVRSQEPTSLEGAESIISAIGSRARAMTSQAGKGWDQVVHVTVGSPGVLDPSGQSLALAPNIPGWERDDVLNALREELGVEVTVENDVNLAALGELALGHGRNVSNFVFFSVGTGIGMGLILNRELYVGASGAAGEIGYLPIGTRRGWAGSGRGSFEKDSAAQGIVRAALQAGVEVDSARAVFDLARRGDRKAVRVVADEARRLALGIATIAPVLDPEVVILGGGIGRNIDLLLGPIEEELEALSPFRPRVVASALGEDAVLHGALAISLHSGRESLFSQILQRTPSATDVSA